MSEVEIERIRDIEDRLADIIFDTWLRKRNSQAKVAEAPENDTLSTNTRVLEKTIFLPESSDTGTG